jgi:predicted amidohydrolase YtcJ
VVYTLSADSPWAEAVAVDDGRIVFVGSGRDASAWTGPGTRTLDLEGRMVLPAFHDSHLHPVTSGIELAECSLTDLASQEEALEAIRRYAEENPDQPWIRGGGWEMTLFPGGNPSKEPLDEIVPDRPVCLMSSDGHSLWVNSRALEAAGIDRDTPDPPAGRIERDPSSGEPNGALHETAMELMEDRLPEYAMEDYLGGLRRALDMAARFGITSLQEASAGEEILEACAELDRRGELTSRVVVSMTVDPEDWQSQIPTLIKWRNKYRGRRFRADTAKIFVDGVVENYTAAVLEPYVDRPGDLGKPTMSPETLDRMVAALDKEKFQIHVHAIGDRGVRMTLDAFEKARAANESRDSRHHIVHLELIHPDDVPRFKQLGVVANFQPLWAYADEYITVLTEPLLGPERSRRLYPIGSLAKSGASVAFGSDWSVSSMNPLEGIEVAVTRRDPETGPGPAWLPEELVDLPTALAAYTIQGARLGFQEAETGSIEAGKAADLIVLDRNLFEIEPHEISETKVLLTLLEGEEVFRDPAFTEL